MAQLTAAADFGSELSSVLRRANQQLGATGLRVAKFIDENRQIVLASSAAALGARIGTSDATVLRTVQTLGFASLAELKSAILNSGSVSTPADDMRRTLVDLEEATGQAFDGILQRARRRSRRTAIGEMPRPDGGSGPRA